jgi:plastocyanin
MTKVLKSILIAALLIVPAVVQATHYNVSIPGFSFSPAALTISLGDTVTWTNNHNSVPHTTTSMDGLWDSGTLNFGQSYTFVFDTVGIFDYHCTIHHAMTGTITVVLPYDILINIQDNYFDPQVVQIQPGQTVRWQNQGGHDHTSTADFGEWDSGMLSNGQFFDFTFPSEGVFDYHCEMHPSMLGTIVAGRPDSVAADIMIVGSDFVPAGLSLPVGSYVRWINFEDMVHTSTSDYGLWDSGDLSAGDYYITQLTHTGDLAYRCTPHGFTDTIYVQDTIPADSIVNIIDFAFGPQVIHIEPGKRIRWVNLGMMDHTATANGGLWDSGNLTPGENWAFTFTGEGVYDYFCAVHPSMVGTVVVGRPDSVYLDIDIVDFEFIPYESTVPVGSYVRWVNYGQIGHTATSDSGAWDSGLLNPGGFYIRQMSNPGDFPYHCDVISLMHGILHVNDTTTTPSCVYLPGDISGDHQRLGADVTYGVRYFKGIGNRPPDSCFMDSTSAYLYVSGDVNGNCEFRGSDITRLVSYFKGSASLGSCHFFPPPPLRGIRSQVSN